MSSFQSMSLIQVNEIIKGIKKNYGNENAITNYYYNNVKSTYVYAKETNKTVAFFADEGDIRRVFFYSTCMDELAGILGFSIENCVIDYIYRQRDPAVEKVFLDAGYKEIACFKRLYNDKINGFLEQNSVKSVMRYYKEDIAEFADDSDMEEIYNRIINDFDIRTEHFPTKDELKDSIKKKQVLIIRNCGLICSYVVFNIVGRTCCLSYGYNDITIDPMNYIVLLIKFYSILKEMGINYSYAWVNENNKSSIGINKKFGYKFDSLEDRIFFKGDKQQ